MDEPKELNPIELYWNSYDFFYQKLSMQLIPQKEFNEAPPDYFIRNQAIIMASNFINILTTAGVKNANSQDKP